MRKNRYELHTLHKPITKEQAIECLKIGFDFDISYGFTPCISQILKGFQKDQDIKITYFIVKSGYKNWYGLLRINGIRYSFHDEVCKSESAFDIQNEMLNKLIAIYKNQPKKNFTIYNYD